MPLSSDDAAEFWPSGGNQLYPHLVLALETVCTGLRLQPSQARE